MCFDAHRFNHGRIQQRLRKFSRWNFSHLPFSIVPFVRDEPCLLPFDRLCLRFIHISTITNCEVSTVFSQTQYCSSYGVCVAVNIPTTHLEATSANPDIFLALQAPSSAEWFATGFGGQMEGTLMLVAWPYNQSVVVSSRLATYPRFCGKRLIHVVAILFLLLILALKSQSFHKMSRTI